MRLPYMHVVLLCLVVYLYSSGNKMKFLLKKLHPVSCNVMMIPLNNDKEEEIICRDFDNFLSFEQYSSSLIIDMLNREMKFESKQYGNTTILNSVPA